MARVGCRSLTMPARKAAGKGIVLGFTQGAGVYANLARCERKRRSWILSPLKNHLGEGTVWIIVRELTAESTTELARHF